MHSKCPCARWLGGLVANSCLLASPLQGQRVGVSRAGLCFQLPCSSRTLRLSSPIPHQPAVGHALGTETSQAVPLGMRQTPMEHVKSLGRSELTWAGDLRTELGAGAQHQVTGQRPPAAWGTSL